MADFPASPETHASTVWLPVAVATVSLKVPEGRRVSGDGVGVTVESAGATDFAEMTAAKANGASSNADWSDFGWSGDGVGVTVDSAGATGIEELFSAWSDWGRTNPCRLRVHGNSDRLSGGLVLQIGTRPVPNPVSDSSVRFAAFALGPAEEGGSDSPMSSESGAASRVSESAAKGFESGGTGCKSRRSPSKARKASALSTVAVGATGAFTGAVEKIGFSAAVTHG
jgi:hypothetical protein